MRTPPERVVTLERLVTRQRLVTLERLGRISPDAASELRGRGTGQHGTEHRCHML
jgi:hypothetical protein